MWFFYLEFFWVEIWLTLAEWSKSRITHNHHHPPNSQNFDLPFLMVLDQLLTWNFFWDIYSHNLIFLDRRELDWRKTIFFWHGVEYMGHSGNTWVTQGIHGSLGEYMGHLGNTWHSGETTSLKKWDNSTLQKPSIMLSYSVGHAAKIEGKRSYSKLSLR